MSTTTTTANTPDDIKVLTLAEAADRWAISADTVRRRIAEGKFPGYRPPGARSIRVLAHEIDAWMLRRVPTTASTDD